MSDLQKGNNGNTTPDLTSQKTQQIGKYTIVDVLDKGAMGGVYKAWDPFIERTIAVKTIRLELLTDENSDGTEIARFKREAQVAGRINHPNILAVYDYGEEGGVSYIAMEYVDGRSLKNYFDANEMFPLPTLFRIMQELLSALGHAHEKGVIHRDIKPANIMLTAAGQVKVTDFGIARIESSTMTQQGSILGTPNYVSPEQFLGQPVDTRSDLYSAGMVLYQLLSGDKAFSGSITTIVHKVLHTMLVLPSALNVTLPAALDGVVMKAIAKKPQDRFQNARAFADGFEQALRAPLPHQEDEDSETTLTMKHPQSGDNRHTAPEEQTLAIAPKPSSPARPPTVRSTPSSGVSAPAPQPAVAASSTRRAAQRPGKVFLIGGVVTGVAATAIGIGVAFVLLRSDPGGGMVERTSSSAVVAPAPTTPPGAVSSTTPPEPAPSVVPDAPVAALSVTEPTVTEPIVTAPAHPEKPPFSTPSARLSPVAELTSDKGPSPAYAVGDALTVVVRMREGGYVYCFYQMHDGSVLRLFPNRYQKEAFLEAGSVLMVPNPDMKFRIVFDVAGVHETIRCFATPSSIATHLPSSLVTTDLAPLGMGLADIAGAFAYASGGEVHDHSFKISVH
ncbi:MAG: serine/threonine protein kinase bacterial [Rhodospirillaceae bacterium]|nr:MAG: serine/threonine protein kinase bacterial [Rhodospirillaceae bacterium]